MLEVEVAALSDVGCRRSNNEDSFGYDSAAQIYAVCDGMGGMAAGEVASSTAVSQLLGFFIAQNTSGDGSAPVEERLYRAIEHANREVRALACNRDELRGMGTTLVAACLDGRRIVIGNVGDSRAYFLRDGGCVQITHDHSFVAEQLRSGVLSVEEAGASPLQSLITRAIGTADFVEPDMFAASLEAGDILLLTTDGLTRYANAQQIAALVLEMSGDGERAGGLPGPRDLLTACRALIDAAKAAGAADNVTCLLLRFSEESRAQRILPEL
ncbi:PP2C family protein-serine/threonine phosphatase [Paracidobacterium acidisoli]|uniref:PP2C family protein-serine/threonine phosphatase n=1 Tax=Paracidobacterium acidisoli TaxID=2303751 RepID=UPI003314B529